MNNHATFQYDANNTHHRLLSVSTQYLKIQNKAIFNLGDTVLANYNLKVLASDCEKASAILINDEKVLAESMDLVIAVDDLDIDGLLRWITIYNITELLLAHTTIKQVALRMGIGNRINSVVTKQSLNDILALKNIV